MGKASTKVSSKDILLFARIIVYAQIYWKESLRQLNSPNMLSPCWIQLHYFLKLNPRINIIVISKYVELYIIFLIEYMPGMKENPFKRDKDKDKW